MPQLLPVLTRNTDERLAMTSIAGSYQPIINMTMYHSRNKEAQRRKSLAMCPAVELLFVQSIKKRILLAYRGGTQAGPNHPPKR